MKIAVLGAGYVGLVTGACLSSMGHEVHVFDTDPAKIAMLSAGCIPIYEPGLEEIIANPENSIQFRLIGDDRKTEHFDAYYIAVGTPRGFRGNADLSYVKSAATWIRDSHLRGNQSMIIIKSTVPPGTAIVVRDLLGEGAADLPVISNPEFLKEGTAIADFMNPDRIICGIDLVNTGGNPEYGNTHFDRFANIYAGSGIDARKKMLVMSNESAELAKYASNGMLATRISFMNEMSRVALKVGAQIDDVKRAVAADSRIGPKFLNAGPGWGGSCFPKDLQALANMANDELPVVEGASRTNEIQMRHTAGRCLRLLGTPARGTKCTLWGAAFKPNTDDTRSSPVFVIAQLLAANGVEVTIHDPMARLSETELARICAVQVDDMYEAAAGAHLVVLLTDWKDYLDADWAKLQRAMRGTCLFDTRNVLDASLIRGHVGAYIHL